MSELRRKAAAGDRHHEKARAAPMPRPRPRQAVTTPSGLRRKAAAGDRHHEKARAAQMPRTRTRQARRSMRQRRTKTPASGAKRCPRGATIARAAAHHLRNVCARTGRRPFLVAQPSAASALVCRTRRAMLHAHVRSGSWSWPPTMRPARMASCALWRAPWAAA
ncbi:hypothetical protein F511_43810 [Dorcoceras hygrometricum]|uniref:Uncharacterized protein n=1 Tax=Dorcoceras hygrometricum TaxID=472368 RepID=A0A2Z7ABN9_9LAMI|nr:hypothetical protein F511_43810 [Dorcoceras hygrometricum]